MAAPSCISISAVWEFWWLHIFTRTWFLDSQFFLFWVEKSDWSHICIVASICLTSQQSFFLHSPSVADVLDICVPPHTLLANLLTATVVVTSCLQVGSKSKDLTCTMYLPLSATWFLCPNLTCEIFARANLEMQESLCPNGKSWPMVKGSWWIRTPPLGRTSVRRFLYGSSQGPQWEWTDWALLSAVGVSKIRYHGNGFPALLFDSFTTPTFLPWGHFLK